MYGQIDVEDALAGTAFALSAAVSTGVATISVIGYDLSGELINLSGTSISMALAISVAALLTAYGTNRMYGSGAPSNLDTDLNDIASGSASIETYVAIATVGVIVANGFNVMGASDFIMANDWAGIAVLATESAGYYVISWMG